MEIETKEQPENFKHNELINKAGKANQTFTFSERSSIETRAQSNIPDGRCKCLQFHQLWKVFPIASKQISPVPLPTWKMPTAHGHFLCKQ